MVMIMPHTITKLHQSIRNYVARRIIVKIKVPQFRTLPILYLEEMNYKLFLLLIGLFQLSCNAQPKGQPTESLTLFNGNDLSGWIIYGTEKWYVEDGLLICESGPDKGYGYLGTEKSFKNFDLSLEFLQGADGNSGVFFRSSINGTKITGWQAEVAPPGKHSGGIYESYGRGWLIKPEPELEKVLKMGHWNKMRIVADGNTVTTYLNGTEMIRFVDDKIGQAEGKIALQIHDGGGIKVSWRNIILKEL